MTAFLPQYDPNPEAREKNLEDNRADYQFDYNYVSPLPMVKKVPFRDQWSVQWLVQVGLMALDIVANYLGAEGNWTERIKQLLRRCMMSRVMGRAAAKPDQLIKLVTDAVAKRATPGRSRSIEDYGNVHEAVTHLGRTHLFVEPFVVTTSRQLADNHPLNLLLRPHFEGTLAINNAAHSRLLANGGAIDELLSGKIESVDSLIDAATLLIYTSSVHYTQLGQYGDLHFDGSRVQEALRRFQQRISDIGRQIEQTNQQRRPYKFLLPTGIPQNINI